MSTLLRHEIVKRKLDRQKDVRLMKSNMAKSVLKRINEELEVNPATTTFRSPLLKDNELIRSQLRNHASKIAGRIFIGRTVQIELDETVKPPEVIITLGPESEPETK